MSKGAASFVYIQDLLEEQPIIPEDSIVSKTLYQDQYIKVILFAFDEGQSLSEHTSAKPATLYFVKGEADLMLGEESRSASAGSWVYMPPGLRHSIKAQTPLIMLLELLDNS